MSRSVYELTLAGHRIRYAFQEWNTKLYFLPLLRRSKDADWDVMLSPEELDEAVLTVPPQFSRGYAEYRHLLLPTARFLQERGCCIFHATAVIFEDRCWLLTAPSGTGKTTQYLNWQRLHPGEIEMLCGDMPVLERREDGVWVHPSPWNGKERFRGFRPAPLAGLVLLEQGAENRLFRLTPREMIEPMFRQISGLPATEEQTRALCRVFDGMLRFSPAWKFVNRGDDDSTELLRNMIRQRGDPCAAL